MRSDGYSTIVDVAEEMLHIQIRKKLAPISRKATQQGAVADHTVQELCELLGATKQASASPR